MDINQEYTTGNRNPPLITFVYFAYYNVTLIFEGNAAGNHLIRIFKMSIKAW